MILLVDEVKKRTQFLRQYLDQLSVSIDNRKYNQALNYISKQKSNIIHTNVSKYNPNTFLIDSLKTKRQKLSHTLSLLSEQKNALLNEISQSMKASGGVQNQLYEQKVLGIISKFQLTLKDVKKVQLQPLKLQSDYQTLKITNIQGKSTLLQHNKVFFLDKKLYTLNVHVNHQNDKIYIILKFENEHSISKWYNSLTFGKILQQAKINRYLFISNKDKDDIQPLINSKQSRQVKLNSEQSDVLPIGTHFSLNDPLRTTFMPQNGLKNKYQTANTSIINEKDISENPFYEPHRHLTTSLINQNPRKISYNYSTYRPSALNRVRGKSMFIEISKGKSIHQFAKKDKDEDQIAEKNNFFQDKSQHSHKKSSSKSNFRKASEDITLRPKNSSNQQKKFQKFRSQRNLIDDILSQAQKTKKNGSMKSKRIDQQIQKKNEILQRSKKDLEKSLHTFSNDERWITQHDEKLSKSSHHTKGRFRQQQEYTLEDPLHSSKNSSGQKQIVEVSQAHQLSPTFPKKIVYEDGSKIHLYPVQTQQSTKKPIENVSSRHSSQQNEDIEPLDQMQQHEIDESRHIRSQRLNTLDSQTQKDHQIHESNSQDHDQEAFQTLLEQLKKGLVLTKCSEGSFWTREKEIKLSENENTLLIIDVKDKKIKKIPISDIISVQYGKFSKGIIKHIQHIEQKKCFLLSVQEGKQVKKVEFVGNNPEKLQIFANNLKYYVQIFKAM